MIKKIYLKNYILIDELTVNFTEGLNVITGETGAGKSILISAIDIVFGNKITKDLIKKGQEKTIIELTLENKTHDFTTLFEENSIDNFEEEIILTKEITQNSSRTRINGTLINQDFIKKLKDILIDIHSQHQTHSFIQQKYHITLLDNYAKASYDENLKEYKNQFKEYQELLKALETAKDSAKTTESQIDFLKFQIEEISATEITDINEEEILKNELIILENSEKLKDLIESSYWALNNDENSILSSLLQIKSNITKASSLDKNLSCTEESIIELTELAKNISSELRNYIQNINNDDVRLNEIQERLHIFEKLKRKYGNTLEEIMKTYEKLIKEYELIEFSTKNINELEDKITNILNQLTEKAQKLSEKRKNYAEVLSSLIIDELEKLELPNSKFKIEIRPTELNQNGKDDVEFLISTNISQDIQPLVKVASGGEISRIILALKTIFAQSDDIDTVIFDEIDTGISGKAAQSVAEEIAFLSKYRQIILITHQAIIASKAENHLYVTKTQNEKTFINIITLSGEEKVKALAGLASGEINENSMHFARSLLSK